MTISVIFRSDRLRRTIKAYSAVAYSTVTLVPRFTRP